MGARLSLVQDQWYCSVQNINIPNINPCCSSGLQCQMWREVFCVLTWVECMSCRVWSWLVHGCLKKIQKLQYVSLFTKALTLVLQTTVSLTENSFKHFIPHKMKLSEGVKMNLSWIRLMDEFDWIAKATIKRICYSFLTFFG